MALTYWQRILLGAAGGILITASLWGFTILRGDIKFLVLISIALGITSVFYARYG